MTEKTEKFSSTAAVAYDLTTFSLFPSASLFHREWEVSTLFRGVGTYQTVRQQDDPHQRRSGQHSQQYIRMSVIRLAKMAVSISYVSRR